MRIRWCSSVAVLLFLTGCFGGAATRYFVLSPVAQQIERTEPEGPVLGIWRASIPEYLDRESLVESSGANEVRIHEGLRWAEPLDQGISRVLRQNIRTFCGGLEVRVLPDTRGREPSLILHPRIRQFERQGDTVMLSASVLAKPQPAPEQSYTVTVPCRGSAGADTVACMSAALAEFSQRLTENYGSLVGCPSTPEAPATESK